MGDTVLYEGADGVATLTLNRPQRLNAITPKRSGWRWHGAWRCYPTTRPR